MAYFVIISDLFAHFPGVSLNLMHLVVFVCPDFSMSLSSQTKSEPNEFRNRSSAKWKFVQFVSEKKRNREDYANYNIL